MTALVYVGGMVVGWLVMQFLFRLLIAKTLSEALTMRLGCMNSEPGWAAPPAVLAYAMLAAHVWFGLVRPRAAR
jgi:hypothetical protein